MTRQKVEAGLALDCAIKSTVPTKTCTCPTHRTTRDLEWLLGLLHGMAFSVASGVYPPCGGPTSGWWCSEKWCDHWTLCMTTHDWPEGPLPALETARTKNEEGDDE